MKTFLLYKDRDFELPQKLSADDRAATRNFQLGSRLSLAAASFDDRQKLPSNEDALMQDLELTTLFNAMALGDEFLFEVAKEAVLSGLSNDVETILYRQDILKDCINNATLVREIYATAVQAIESERKSYFNIFSRYTASVLYSAIEVLQMFVGTLKKLRRIAGEQSIQFQSEGFTALFAMLRRELDDKFFAEIQTHLKNLKFRDGVLISAELGKGNKGIRYILRKPSENHRSWIDRVFLQKPAGFTFQLHPRDENGAKALSELQARGTSLVANAVAQSAEHILNFLSMLKTELAFYIGCLNLRARLTQIGEPICFPKPAPTPDRQHSFHGLYDVCLALSMKRKVMGNDVRADDKKLVIITGANQGGKSTFLRSIGLAQLMMQSGMFVPADSFCANICDRLFTHYKREEDVSMKSGKFDEELSRMNEIVDHITPNSIVLFNESFAATNEREGSEIARQIVTALVEKQVKIFFVSHLYDFARGFYDEGLDSAIFLRAERQSDGTRTFKLIEGEPLDTSYGEDLYRRIFQADGKA
jgi:DNA mismatch repair ATPase MutS